jgi:hypothetical protein
MTEDMNSTVISYTPRQNSIETTDAAGQGGQHADSRQDQGQHLINPFPEWLVVQDYHAAV